MQQMYTNSEQNMFEKEPEVSWVDIWWP